MVALVPVPVWHMCCIHFVIKGRRIEAHEAPASGPSPSPHFLALRYASQVRAWRRNGTGGRFANPMSQTFIPVMGRALRRARQSMNPLRRETLASASRTASSARICCSQDSLKLSRYPEEWSALFPPYGSPNNDGSQPVKPEASPLRAQARCGFAPRRRKSMTGAGAGETRAHGAVPVLLHHCCQFPDTSVP